MVKVLKIDNKQLLDQVFVISRIIKVEVGVISQSRRLRLITLTETICIITSIIIHRTHFLFSDWPKAYSEFSKSALVTSSLEIIQ